MKLNGERNPISGKKAWAKKVLVKTVTGPMKVSKRIYLNIRQSQVFKKKIIGAVKKSPLLTRIARKIDIGITVSAFKLKKLINPLQNGEWPRVGPNDHYRPLVSVIVPNYNHQPFLRERLESIFNQEYDHFEVILMDDGSTDDSREILLEYTRRYPEKTRTVFNETNSGGVFRQWKKGLSMAKGELIWIAESDDYCTHNFLSSLIPFFIDESVMIGYCRTDFMSQGKKVWDIETYLADIDPDKWRHNFLESAHDLVNSAMGLKNVIPNVSSAIFRHPGEMFLIDGVKWESLRFCGDWVFYLHLMRGGAVAYSTECSNYYRQHDHNTSTVLQNQDVYYNEHEYVATVVAELYAVTGEIFDKQQNMLRDYWKLHRDDYDEEHFRQCYDLRKIKDKMEFRKPNLAICGFSFSAGGGETFPIVLANVFHDGGYSVVFVNFDRDVRVPGVRKMLNSAVPVINLTEAFLLPTYMNLAGVEVLHSHHGYVDSTISNLKDYMPKCRHVVSLHGFYETMDDLSLQDVLPSIMDKVDYWVYTTDKNLQTFKRFGYYREDKFSKIGNALLRMDIQPISRAELGIHDDAFLLCLVSRAIPEKGWEEAIRSVEMARSMSCRDIQLILIGDGEEKERLQPQSAGYVHFLGFKDNIRDYYGVSDMGFLPSRFHGESFPLTIIDCLFAGKPVLASEIGEIRSMLTTGENKLAGAVFALDNWTIPQQELAGLIMECATNPETYSTMLAEVETAAKKFDSANLMSQYAAVYERLADKEIKE